MAANGLSEDMKKALREAYNQGDISLPDYLAHLKEMREAAATTSAPHSCSPTTAATSGKVRWAAARPARADRGVSKEERELVARGTNQAEARAHGPWQYC